MKKVLILADHPDDEVLGCGATIYQHTKNGDQVDVIFFTNGESSRDFTEEKSEIDAIETRNLSALKVSKFLKINQTLFLDFPDNKMDLISTLDVAKIIEREIIKNKYEIIYTHCSSDLNVDHRKICDATFVACRPVMGTSIEMVLTYEVPSSTEWGSLFYDKNFDPNFFRNIEDTREFKLQALKLYESEIRNFPHPRSILAIESLEIIRGSTAGFKYAEAYNLVYYRHTNV